MTQQAPAAEPKQPTCVICAMWQRLPYHKRWSTPVPTPEAESLLAIGYWLRRSLEGSVARFCEKHATLLSALDNVQLTDPSALTAPPTPAPAQAPVQMTQASVPPMPQQPTPGVHSTEAQQTQPVPGVLPTAAQLAPPAPRVVQPIPGVVPGGPLPQLLYDPNTIQAPAHFPAHPTAQPAPVPPPPGIAAAQALAGGATPSQAAMAEVAARVPSATLALPVLPAVENHPEATLGQIPTTCPLCKKPLEKGMHICQAG